MTSKICITTGCNNIGEVKKKKIKSEKKTCYKTTVFQTRRLLSHDNFRAEQIIYYVLPIICLRYISDSYIVSLGFRRKSQKIYVL